MAPFGNRFDFLELALKASSHICTKGGVQCCAVINNDLLMAIN